MSATPGATKQPDAFDAYYPTGTLQIGVAAKSDPTCVGYYTAKSADVDALKTPYADRRHFSYLRTHMDNRSTVMQKALPDDYNSRSRYLATMETLQDCYLVISDRSTGVTSSGEIQEGANQTLFFNGKTFQAVKLPDRTLGQYTSIDHAEMDQILHANQLVCKKALEAYTQIASTVPLNTEATGKAFTDYKIAYNRFDVTLKVREDLVDSDPSASSADFRAYQKDAHDFDPIEHFIKLAPKYLENVCSSSSTNPSATKNQLANDLFEHYKVLKQFLKQTEAFVPAEAEKILLTEVVQRLNEAFTNSPSTLESVKSANPDLHRAFETDKQNCKEYSNADFVRVLTNLKTTTSQLPSYIEKIASPKQKKIAELWFKMKDGRLKTLENEKLPYHPRSLARAAIGLGYTFYDAAKGLVKPSILTDAKTAKIMKKYFENRFQSDSIFPTRQATASSIQEALDSFDLLTDLCPKQTAYDRSELHLDLIKETMSGTAKTQKDVLLSAKSLADFQQAQRDKYDPAVETQEKSIKALKAIADDYPDERSTLYISSTKGNYEKALELYNENKYSVLQKEFDLLLSEIENLSKVDPRNSNIATHNTRLGDILTECDGLHGKSILERKRAQSNLTISAFTTPQNAYKRSEELLAQIRAPLSKAADMQQQILLNAQDIRAFEANDKTTFKAELAKKQALLQTFSEVNETHGTQSSKPLFGRPVTVAENYEAACQHYVGLIEPVYTKHLDLLTAAPANDLSNEDKTIKLDDFLKDPFLVLPSYAQVDDEQQLSAHATELRLTNIKDNAMTARIASIEDRLNAMLNQLQAKYGVNNDQSAFAVNTALLTLIQAGPTATNITNYLSNYAQLEADLEKIEALLDHKELPANHAKTAAIAAFKAAIQNNFNALYVELEKTFDKTNRDIKRNTNLLNTYHFQNNTKTLEDQMILFKTNTADTIKTFESYLTNIPTTLSEEKKKELTSLITTLNTNFNTFENALTTFQSYAAQLPAPVVAAPVVQPSRLTLRNVAIATVAVAAVAAAPFVYQNAMMAQNESN